jgi:hypothetical protein
MGVLREKRTRPNRDRARKQERRQSWQPATFFETFAQHCATFSCALTQQVLVVLTTAGLVMSDFMVFTSSFVELRRLMALGLVCGLTR